jgi:hypothetical protein
MTQLPRCPCCQERKALTNAGLCADCSKKPVLVAAFGSGDAHEGAVSLVNLDVPQSACLLSEL